MMELTPSWDPAKAKSNTNKHGTTFEEAATVFRDANERLIHDPDHSQTEDRFLLLGLSARLRLLAVAHSYRKGDCEIRIISARKATRREREQYEGFS